MTDGECDRVVKTLTLVVNAHSDDAGDDEGEQATATLRSLRSLHMSLKVNYGSDAAPLFFAICDGTLPT